MSASDAHRLRRVVDGTAEAEPRLRHAAAATVLACAVFLVLFDSLAVATALPTIARDLAVTMRDIQWVVTANSLAIGALLLLGGRVADRFGRRSVLIGSLVLLAGSTALAAAAPSLAVLLVGRALQGLAAAFALPASLAMAGSLFPEEPWRSRAFGIISMSAGTAGLAGALCGGLLTTAVGWRWIFLATVPACVAAIAGAVAFLPLNRDRRAATEPLDARGAIATVAVLVLLIYGIGNVGESGLLASDVAVPIVVGLAILERLVGHQRRMAQRRERHDQQALQAVREARKHGRPAVRAAMRRWRETKVARPFLPFKLLRNRPFAGGCLATSANSATYVAVIVVGSLQLQDVHDLSAATAGLMLAPSLVGTALVGVVAAALVRRWGSRWAAAGGLALGAASLTLLALTADAGGLVLGVLPGFFLRGVSGGLVYVALTREAVGGTGEAERSAASGLFEATTHVAGAVAVSTYIAVCASALGYSGAYLVGAAFAVAGAVAALVLLPADDRERAGG